MWTRESNKNPNLNELLNLSEEDSKELFKHCWLLLDELPDITVGIEPYDRDLSHEDVKDIIKLITGHKVQIHERTFTLQKEGISIIDYVFCGPYDTFIGELE